MPLTSVDRYLHQPPPAPLQGWKRGALEFLYFGIKEARACLFAGLFFSSVLLVPKSGWLGIPRYDLLFLIAIGIQLGMLWSKLETLDELKAVALFHLAGFALEVFKVSGSIQSWAYPEAAYTKFWGVPLFSGFMYASVGSYIIQAWRLFDLRIRHHPSYWMAALIALLIYVNFLPIITSAIIAGILRPVRWVCMRVRQCSSALGTRPAACRCFWHSS
jgi:uncharacterized membrane protein YoaT (DUF817 family)